jgi:hypothetical protein
MTLNREYELLRSSEFDVSRSLFNVFIIKPPSSKVKAPHTRHLLRIYCCFEMTPQGYKDVKMFKGSMLLTWRRSTTPSLLGT